MYFINFPKYFFRHYNLETGNRGSHKHAESTMINFVAYGSAEHDNGYQLSGNELKHNYSCYNGLASQPHSGFLVRCRSLKFDYTEPVKC